jgi:hypothetical protein
MRPASMSGNHPWRGDNRSAISSATRTDSQASSIASSRICVARQGLRHSGSPPRPPSHPGHGVNSDTPADIAPTPIGILASWVDHRRLRGCAPPRRRRNRRARSRRRTRQRCGGAWLGCRLPWFAVKSISNEGPVSALRRQYALGGNDPPSRSARAFGDDCLPFASVEEVGF